MLCFEVFCLPHIEKVTDFDINALESRHHENNALWYHLLFPHQYAPDRRVHGPMSRMCRVGEEHLMGLF